MLNDVQIGVSTMMTRRIVQIVSLLETLNLNDIIMTSLLTLVKTDVSKTSSGDLSVITLSITFRPALKLLMKTKLLMPSICLMVECSWMATHLETCPR